MLAQSRKKIYGTICFTFLFLISISSANQNPKTKKRAPNTTSQETASSNAYFNSRDESFARLFAKITEELERESRQNNPTKVAHRKVIDSYKNRLEQLRTIWSKEDQDSQKCESIQLIFKKGMRIQRNPDKFQQEIIVSHQCDVRVDQTAPPSLSNLITQSLEVTLVFGQSVNCQNFVSCNQPPQTLEILSLNESSKIPGTPLPAGGMSTSGGD